MGFISNIFKIGSRWVKNHAPELMIGVGTAAMGVGSYFAFADAPKATAIIEKNRKFREEVIKPARAKVINGEETEISYSKTDYAKDLTMSYIRQGIEVIGAEKRAIGCLTFGTGMITGGTCLFIKKTNDLMSTVTTLAGTCTALKAQLDEAKNDVVSSTEKTIKNPDGTKSIVTKTTMEKTRPEGTDADGFLDTPITGPWSITIGPGDHLYDVNGGDIDMILPALWILQSEANSKLDRDHILDLQWCLYNIGKSKDDYNVTTARNFGWKIDDDGHLPFISFGIGDMEHPEIITKEDPITGRTLLVLDFNCCPEPLGDAWETVKTVKKNND